MDKREHLSLFILLVLIFTILPINKIYADETKYTVDDVRDILGKARLDDKYTESEIAEIERQYNDIERQNAYAKMFELGNALDINSDVEEQYLKLEEEITKLKKELAKSFSSGEVVSEVLKLNTKLDIALAKIESLNPMGYSFEVEYVENVWEEEYLKVQENIKELSEDYIIGALGQSLKSPVQGRFYLTSLFGFRLDPVMKDKMTLHNGIDLAAEENQEVLAQFNGIVTNVYTSEAGGNTVEISHGESMITKYLHLNKALVKIGQEVKQYEVIGLAGNTGTRSTGTHLHFSVVLDGEYINPIYLYGTNGLNAFKTYISNDPERNRELIDVISNIKDAPTKIEEVEEVKENRYPRSSGEEILDEEVIFTPQIELEVTPYDPSQPFLGNGVVVQTDEELLDSIISEEDVKVEE